MTRPRQSSTWYPDGYQRCSYPPAPWWEELLVGCTLVLLIIVSQAEEYL